MSIPEKSVDSATESLGIWGLTDTQPLRAIAIKGRETIATKNLLLFIIYIFFPIE